MIGEYGNFQNHELVLPTKLAEKYKHPCLVTLYRHHFKNQVRHYMKFEPKPSDDGPNSSVSTPLNFKYLRNCHWQIETYHRTIKQCWGQQRIRRK